MRQIELLEKKSSTGSYTYHVPEKDWAELKPVCIEAMMKARTSEVALGRELKFGAKVVGAMLTTDKSPRHEYAEALCQKLGVEVGFLLPDTPNARHYASTRQGGAR